MEERSTANPPGREGLNLLDYWHVSWTRRRILGLLCFGTMLGATVLGLLQEARYESTATIIAPKEGGSGGFASTLMASGLIPSTPGLSPPSLTANRGLFMIVLKSRTMAKAVVERFGLKERYRARYEGDAIRKLQEETTISLSKEGVISVKVEETDPGVAADIANFYLEHLNRMLSGFKTTEAGKQKTFIGSRLAETVKDLRQAEEALRRFQETHRAVSLPEQAKSAVEAAAQLKGQTTASEIQLEVLRNFATDENQEVMKLKRSIEESKRQLAEMQYGDGRKSPAEGQPPEGSRKEINIPFAEFPELGLELARLMREVKVQETVYTLLTQLLEEAKIAEARDLPTVQVLDRAVPAERKSGPHVIRNVIMTGFTSLFLGVFFAFFLEYLEKLRRKAGPAENLAQTVRNAPAEVEPERRRKNQ